MSALSHAFGMPSLSMPSLFTDLPSADMPALGRALAVDIKDAGDSLVISADVPGLSKEDIKVQVGGGRVWMSTAALLAWQPASCRQMAHLKCVPAPSFRSPPTACSASVASAGQM